MPPTTWSRYLYIQGTLSNLYRLRVNALYPGTAHTPVHRPVLNYSLFDCTPDKAGQILPGHHPVQHLDLYSKDTVSLSSFISSYLRIKTCLLKLKRQYPGRSSPDQPPGAQRPEFIISHLDTYPECFSYLIFSSTVSTLQKLQYTSIQLLSQPSQSRYRLSPQSR
jgi:hypothetical protein